MENSIWTPRLERGGKLLVTAMGARPGRVPTREGHSWRRARHDPKASGSAARPSCWPIC